MFARFKMKIEAAQMGIWNGNPAILLQASKRDIQAFLREFENKYPMEVEISLKRKKRSQNANAYCWILCDRIAEKVGITKEEVYRSHIQSVGTFADVQIRREAVDEYRKNWSSNGVGWMTETLYARGEWATIRSYYGSSTYDTKQMARLIDNIIYEAKELGIETLTPNELERMKQAWSTR